MSRTRTGHGTAATLTRRGFLALAAGAATTCALAGSGATVALARSGSNVFYYEGAGVFVRFRSTSGTYAYCLNVQKHGPYNDQYGSWDWTGEAPRALTIADQHALAWLVAHGYPATSTIGGSRADDPYAVTQCAVWMLQGTVSQAGVVLWDGRDTVATGQISRADVARAWTLSRQALSHAGEADWWDSASKVWNDQDKDLQPIVEWTWPRLGSARLQKQTVRTW